MACCVSVFVGLAISEKLNWKAGVVDAHRAIGVNHGFGKSEYSESLAAFSKSLAGYVGAESVNRCLPIAMNAGVPFVAPLTGAESLRRNPSRWLFHVRPGLQAETRLIAQAMQTFDIARVAVLVQDDADGVAGLEALSDALVSLKAAKPVAVARVGRNSTGQVELKSRDTAAAALMLAAAQPQALVCLAAYASTAAVLKSMRDGGFAGPCYATSLSSAAAIAPLLGARTAGLYVTQVVPSP